MKHLRHAVLFTAGLLFFLVVNSVWLYRDHSIPAWDDAYYLTNSLRTYDALTDHGLGGLTSQFLSGMANKPPLIATLPIPVYLAAGRHPRAALVVNLGFLLAILTATYWTARVFAGSRAGLVAMATAGTMPMIYGLSRLYLVECGLTALVALALLILVTTEVWPLGAAMALGVVCGFGLLMKSSYPLYLAVPLLWLFVTSPVVKLVTRKSVLAFAVPLLVIAGPWYLVNGASALRTALAAGSAETALAYKTGGVAETGRYLLNLVNCGPALYFAAIPILALACLGRMSAGVRRGIPFCLAGSAPVLFLACSHYRDLRYAAPLFPIFAVALGILADAAMERFPVPATALAGLLLAVGTADMLGSSFTVKPDHFAGGLLLSAGRFSYVRPPQVTPSPYDKLLDALVDRGHWSVGAHPRLVLGSDTRYCNADTIGLAALTKRIPLQVATTAYESPASLHQSLATASYFLYVERAPDSAFNPLGPVAIATVATDPRFHLIGWTNLPDGSLLRVLEAQAPLALEKREDTVAECSVRFADGIELIGLSLRRSADGIEARYRWRCWRPVTKNYWTFGHVLDAQGKVLGYLDHVIVEKTPPTQWRAGDIANEQVTVPLERGVPASVRLGVFDRPSGDRLAIARSNFPVTDAATATVAPVK